MAATNTTHSKSALMLIAAAVIGATVLFAAREAQGLAAVRAASAPTRVAVVDAMTVVNSLEELEARQNDFNAAITEAQTRLDSLKGEEERMIEDLQTMEFSDSEQRERLIELAELRGRAAGTREALEGVLGVEQGRIIASLYSKVTDTVADIARREGYDLVLVNDSSITPPADAPSQAVQQTIRNRRVLYTNEALDITQLVIDEMNALFRAG